MSSRVTLDRECNKETKSFHSQNSSIYAALTYYVTSVRLSSRPSLDVLIKLRGVLFIVYIYIYIYTNGFEARSHGRQPTLLIVAVTVQSSLINIIAL